MAGFTTGALLAATAVSAGASIIGGQKQAKSAAFQGEWNAQVYEQQASMIQEKKKLTDYQFNRQAAKARGSIVSRTAGNGFNLGGSPLAILIDNESQMLLDQAVGNYNLDVERNFALSGANFSRATGSQQASLAKFTGYTNAFSTVLNSTYEYGKLNQKPKKI